MNIIATEQENIDRLLPSSSTSPSVPDSSITSMHAPTQQDANTAATEPRVPLGVRQHRQASKPVHHEARDSAKPYNSTASKPTRISKRLARRSIKAKQMESNVSKITASKAPLLKPQQASVINSKGRPAKFARHKQQEQPPPPPQKQEAILPTKLAESNQMSARTPRRVGNPAEHGGLTDTDICDLDFDVLINRIARFKPALQNKIKSRRRKLKNRIHARRAASKREGKQHSLTGVNSALERESVRLSSENERLMQDNQALETKSYALNRQLASHDEEMNILQRKLKELQARITEAQSQASSMHVAPSC